MTVLVGDQIEGARFLTLTQMLKLEIYGLYRSKSPSAYAIIKRDYGMKGNKQQVYQQCQTIKERMFKGANDGQNREENVSDTDRNTQQRD
jgi:hypothetical protein